MGLTLQFVPYTEIEGLSSLTKIHKLLKMAKEDKIVVLQGRLKKDEEAELIRVTMEEIDEDFKGIELSVIYPENQNQTTVNKLKFNLANMLLGERTGLTIIGPANIVKEIKQDPSKIQLFTEDKAKPKKKGKK